MTVVCSVLVITAETNENALPLLGSNFRTARSNLKFTSLSKLVLGSVIMRFMEPDQSLRPWFDQANDLAETPGIAALETGNSLL